MRYPPYILLALLLSCFLLVIADLVGYGPQVGDSYEHKLTRDRVQIERVGSAHVLWNEHWAGNMSLVAADSAAGIEYSITRGKLRRMATSLEPADTLKRSVVFEIKENKFGDPEPVVMLVTIPALKVDYDQVYKSRPRRGLYGIIPALVVILYLWNEKQRHRPCER